MRRIRSGFVGELIHDGANIRKFQQIDRDTEKALSPPVIIVFQQMPENLDLAVQFGLVSFQPDSLHLFQISELIFVRDEGVGFVGTVIFFAGEFLAEITILEALALAAGQHAARRVLF